MHVPCGKCGACRHNRRAMWSYRLEQEQHDSLNAWFITLTYSDENLVFGNVGDGPAILVKRDLQKFLKRLRYYQDKADWPHKFRYYAVGEYGSKFGRPHYHIIGFNLAPSLLPLLRRIWPQGFADFSPVRGGALHYVAKFHVNADCDSDGRPAEFATMSRNPGIGAGYLDRIGDWHHRGDLRGFVRNGRYHQSMPRYYRDKLFSKLESAGLSGKHAREAEERYESEVNRLTQLKIENPDLYLFESAFHYASKVTRKSDSDTF